MKETTQPEKVIYTAYSQNDDLTFIMEDTKDGENVIATECKGFYFGMPDEESTQLYYGKLSAQFEL